MADLTITATQVLEGPDARITHGRAGVALTAGQLVYFEQRSGRFLPADANLSQDAAEVVGVALNSCGAQQSVRVQTEGTITLGAGAAPVVGTFYVLSATSGAWAPVADLAAGWYRTFVGVGDIDNTVAMSIVASGIVATV